VAVLTDGVVTVLNEQAMLDMAGNLNPNTLNRIVWSRS